MVLIVPYVALTVHSQVGKFITIRNLLAHDAGGWKSKIQGSASTKGRLTLTLQQEGKERQREQEEAEFEDDTDIRNSPTRSELLKDPPPNTSLH